MEFNSSIVDKSFIFDAGDRSTNYVLVFLAWLASQDANKCNPSITDLSKACHMNRSSIIRCIKKLEKLGVIKKEKSGLRGNNKYSFTEWFLDNKCHLSRF